MIKTKKRAVLWSLLLRKHSTIEGVMFLLVGIIAICSLGWPRITTKGLFITAGVCFILHLIIGALSLYLGEICFPDGMIEKNTENAIYQLREELFPYEDRYEKDSNFFLVAAIGTGIIGLSLSLPYSWIAFIAIISLLKGIYDLIMAFNSTFPESNTAPIIKIVISAIIILISITYEENQFETKIVSILIQSVFFIAVLSAVIYHIKKIIDEYRKEKKFSYKCKNLLYYFLLHIGLIAWNVFFHCILKL